MRVSRWSCCAIAWIALTACDPGPSTPVAPTGRGADWLTDVTSGSGLDFRHESRVEGDFFFPEIVGSGVALFDHDADGDLDVYLIQSGTHDGVAPVITSSVNRLYSRQPDGSYVDRTAESGLGDPGYGMGATVGDVDNDGDLDVYVTNYGPDRLYRNRGDGTFVEDGAAAGIAADVWSTSAAFCDYDADGWLDLFVATYVQMHPARRCADAGDRPEYCAPTEYRGAADLLYRNRGDGTFANVTDEALEGAGATRGLGLACADFDRDGRADFYVANDAEPNELWINRGDGTFVDRGVVTGTAVNLFGRPEGSMGVAVGDAQGDGRLDLFLTHLGRETNTLYVAGESGSFQDATATAGLGPPSLPHTGFGTVFADIDHDGDLDLITVNGRVARAETASGPRREASGWIYSSETFRGDYGEPDQLFVNDGTGRFRDGCDAAPALCAVRAVGRGLAAGDLDGDGDLDLVVADSNGPARLLRNDVPKLGRWLVVRAVDPTLRRDAIGALVHVVAGGREQLRLVTRATSYLSSSDAAVHFGLGRAERIEALWVEWPGGARESFEPPEPDRSVVVEKGRGARR